VVAGRLSGRYRPFWFSHISAFVQSLFSGSASARACANTAPRS
jgi:hypothetical protein